MHYTGTIWRPPYEADSLLLEVTAGCTHRKCKFCTLYDDLPFKFRITDTDTLKADLLEAQIWLHDPLRKMETHLFGLSQPKDCRVFLTGANPFALKTERLLDIAELIRRHFPTCESIGCFAHVTDASSKSDEELAALAAAGYSNLTIGIETADDDALDFMNKGYCASDIVEQCGRLDAAGVTYSFFYLTGISGKGRGIEGASATAQVCNQLHPLLIGANMLTIFPNSELAREIERGRWTEESEIEKYEEVKTLVSGLGIECDFAMLGASNPVMIAGRLPAQKSQIIDALDSIINDIGEDELRRYRTTLRHL